MIQALSYALSALNASNQRLNTHANNIVNANTTGFKSRRALQSTGPGGHGTRISSTSANFSQGPLIHTGQAYDMALQGDGFFALEGGGLTRDGAFAYDANGDLVTANGRRVVPGQVTGFNNPNGLREVGDNTYVSTEVSGVGVPRATEIVPGMLEGSNTDMATEIVGTMFAQRSFEANLAMVRTTDEMTGTLLSMVA